MEANIANFGGDPARITLWGQSAGAGSVTAYSYAYPENPIVAALIADSGAPGIIDNKDYAHTNFTFLAGRVGCGGLSSTEEISCMRNVSAQTLQAALSTYSGPPSISFMPSVDNKTVFANWTERALEGKVAKIVSQPCPNPDHSNPTDETSPCLPAATPTKAPVSYHSPPTDLVKPLSST